MTSGAAFSVVCACRVCVVCRNLQAAEKMMVLWGWEWGRSRTESDPGIWDDPNLAAQPLLLGLEAQLESGTSTEGCGSFRVFYASPSSQCGPS